MKIALLKGGISSEREISLVTGTACAEALRGLGHEVTEIDAHPARLEAALRKLSPDLIFNALHGDWGEDGEVQRILDGLRLPYTHSGAKASALAMNKDHAKAVLRKHGITVPEGKVLSRAEIAKGGAMPTPYVVKPNGQGSSKSVYLIMEETPEALAKIAADHAMGEDVIIEQYIPGRELTVTVMGDRALAVTEIIPEGWYDFTEKYGDNAARHELPANIPAEATELCLRWALEGHRALGCRGLTRTDFRFDDTENADNRDMTNKVVTLEINTQPGMTPTSLSPEQAMHVGIDFAQLCRWMVEDASWPR
jgi:D-alanine-D-alanine ligase